MPYLLPQGMYRVISRGDHSFFPSPTPSLACQAWKSTWSKWLHVLFPVRWRAYVTGVSLSHICDFKLDMSCPKNPTLLEIDQPKVDQHKLHLLMKKVSFHLWCLRVRRWSISLYVSTLQLHVPYPLCLLSQMTLNNAVILLALGRGLVDVDMSIQIL